MAEKTVATTAVPETVPATPPTEDTRARERYITPPADIYETPDSLVVMVDMAGVSQDNLEVRVDNHVLTMRGTARHAAPGSVVYREYELVNYFRQFELSNSVDEAKISAELKHGVLRIDLPKPEAAKPRRIAVQVG
jgi:HSP20 family protein